MTHAGRIDGVREISNSEVQAFKTCRREWWLRWYRGLRPRVELPVAKRDSGTRIHAALQQWYVPEGFERTDPREAIELEIMADQKVIRDHLVASGWEAMPSEHHDMIALVKANDIERLMIEGYMQWIEETGADAYLEVIAPEVRLSASLPELECDDVRITGKLDVRVRRVSDGARMFIDHKTRDVMPKLSELERDEQMLHYELLEELADSDTADYCDGALYNVLRRTKRTVRAKPPFYARHFVPHNEYTKRSFRTRLAATIRDMISVEAALDQGADHLSAAYPHPGKDCEWRCPFAGVCTMFDDGSYVEEMISHHYRTDNPLHYYGDTKIPVSGQENDHERHP